jgi:predicted RNase H-like HicB family nuclease
MGMEYVILTFVAQREGKYFVSECSELGTSSFGATEREALESLADATSVYLDTLDDLGETHEVLDQKGVKIYSFEPANLEVRKSTKFPAGSLIQPRVLQLQHSHA